LGSFRPLLAATLAGYACDEQGQITVVKNSQVSPLAAPLFLVPFAALAFLPVEAADTNKLNNLSERFENAPSTTIVAEL
jgi:hypothetical protein